MTAPEFSHIVTLAEAGQGRAVAIEADQMARAAIARRLGLVALDRFTVTAPGPGSTTGTIFDNEFALLSIQGNEVTIQVGDDTPFDLRKGVSHQLV